MKLRAHFITEYDDDGDDPPEISKLPAWPAYQFWDPWSKFLTNSQQ